MLLRSLDTQNFIDDIKKYYLDTFNIALDDALFNQWIFTEGLPADCPVPRSDRFDKVDVTHSTLERW